MLKAVFAPSFQDGAGPQRRHAQTPAHLFFSARYIYTPWLNEGSCLRLRPTHAQHDWSYDFVHHATHDGRSLRLMTLIDEYTRQCLAIRVERRITGPDVVDILSDAMLMQGVPEHIRSDNGNDLEAGAGLVGTA